MGELAEPEAAMAAPEPSSCLTLRVFYLRVSRCEVDESMLDTLTLTHTPLTTDTDLQVMSGADQKPSSISSGGTVSCSLRRDRVDASSQEATFVSTEAVRMSGSVRFEVHSKDERIMVGILEMCDAEGKKSWVMKCQATTQRGSGFLRCGGGGAKPPAVEVYVAGVFRSTPIVFTKAMQLRFRRRRQVKPFMDPIPECGEQAEDMKETPPKHGTQRSSFQKKSETPNCLLRVGCRIRSTGATRPTRTTRTAST
ncbi:unnamed protein product [Urochloa humidicola]